MKIFGKIISVGGVLCVVAVAAYLQWGYLLPRSFIIPFSSYNVIARGRATEQMMFDYVRAYNEKITSQRLRYIVKTYIWECEYEGVNHDIAFVQMCHETNFLRFGGEIDSEQNNFGGLGTMDYDIYWACFFSIRRGVRAHVQHLKAYGSKLPLKNECVDSRFGIVQRGSARSARALTGKWYADGNYGDVLLSKVSALLKMK
ncbi:MAG: glucosaminidase domain-containing protein [Puniceicoccales bacterium]|jgi:hypothetical protein|nr:glucosaminidase domain-containing protein [Puniceicoccales bacterium]